MFGYGKKHGRNNRRHLQNQSGTSKTGLLYCKVGKDGVVQAWLHGWKETKMNEYFKKH